MDAPERERDDQREPEVHRESSAVLQVQRPHGGREDQHHAGVQAGGECVQLPARIQPGVCGGAHAPREQRECENQDGVQDPDGGVRVEIRGALEEYEEERVTEGGLDRGHDHVPAARGRRAGREHDRRGQSQRAGDGAARGPIAPGLARVDGRDEQHRQAGRLKQVRDGDPPLAPLHRQTQHDQPATRHREHHGASARGELRPRPSQEDGGRDDRHECAGRGEDVLRPAAPGARFMRGDLGAQRLGERGFDQPGVQPPPNRLVDGVAAARHVRLESQESGVLVKTG